MGLRWTLRLAGASLLGLAGALAVSVAADPMKPAGGAEKADFAKDVRPLLTNYCIRCHGGEKPKGGLTLEKYKSEAEAQRDRQTWEKVVKVVRAGEMPPEGRRKPPGQEIERFASWIEGQFGTADCTLNKDPGRVTIRRLNRVEYNNTVRDLVGVNFRPADDFPSDDVGYGFDNIGDVLSLPPLLMEKYLAAAEKIVDAAFKSPDSKRRIFICQPGELTKLECARKILDHFASRAYRRPVRSDELDRLLRFVSLADAQGDPFEQGVRVALQAVLVSPNFLFRVELDQPRNFVALYRRLNDYEVASRLSYFLWSTMPDEELFGLAKQEKLRKEGVLEAQIQRMLKDPKARALVDNFAGQWLQLRLLKTVTPDPGQFPKFDEALRSAMQRETELFFEAVMKEDRSILDFLDADFTFVNERLAKHYGIPDVRGSHFRKVQLTGDQRGGVLTMASVLTVTSNPTRTSPVKRGKWILENLLGTPPPPPPPGAGELSDDQQAVLSGSLRQRMEQHRADPNCAVCHQKMDPLGFGFENFDAVGAWRTHDGKFLIDPSGELPGGRSFKGPRELKAILKTKEEDFRRCLAEKMLTYALGRGVEYSDKCTVEQISAATAKSDNRFSGLVQAIVSSEPFQNQRGRGGRR